MSDQTPEKPGSITAPTGLENMRPVWLKKDFDGMLQKAPHGIPGKPRFRPRLAEPSHHPLKQQFLQQTPWRLVGILLVVSLVFAFFYLSPRLTENAFRVSGLTDLIIDPTRPAQTAVLDPARANSLKNLYLDARLLNRWSDQKWSLLYTSSDLGLSLTNSKLYSNLLSLKPKEFSSQDFVQEADPCLQQTCQVSWAGILFDNAALAFQAFDVLDKDLKASTSEYQDLGFTDGGTDQPRRSCVSKAYAESGWVSCLFHWNNLVTSIRTYTQSPDDPGFVNASVQLIEQVNSDWVRQWNLRLERAPIP